MDELKPAGNAGFVQHWPALVMSGILIIGAGVLGWQVLAHRGDASSKSSNETAQSSNSAVTPQFIQADFIDLSKIFSITKFRSGAGHDFSVGSGETCRSMKHYFGPQANPVAEQQKAANGLPPAPDGKTDTAIFSPVDGTLIEVQNEQTPIGKQLWIQPNSAKDYTVRLFHVYPLDGVVKGSKLAAGQKIGVIGQYSDTDIAVMHGKSFVSYFDVMPDSIFAKYQARGISSRADLIITKQYRDAHPLQCNGENFAVNYASDPNNGDTAYLSGYLGQKPGDPAPAGSSSATKPSASAPAPSNLSSGATAGSGPGTGGGGGAGGGNGSGKSH